MLLRWTVVISSALSLSTLILTAAVLSLSKFKLPLSVDHLKPVNEQNKYE